MADVGELQARLTADVSNFVKGMATGSDEAQRLVQQLTQVGAAGDALRSEFEAGIGEGIRAEFGEMQKAAGSVGAAMQSIGANLDTFSAGTTKAARAGATLTTTLATMAGAGDVSAAGLQRTALGISQLITVTGESTAGIAKLTSGILALGVAGAAGAAAGRLLAGGFEQMAEGAKKAGDRIQALADVSKQIGTINAVVDAAGADTAAAKIKTFADETEAMVQRVRDARIVVDQFGNEHTVAAGQVDAAIKKIREERQELAFLKAAAESQDAGKALTENIRKGTQDAITEIDKLKESFDFTPATEQFGKLKELAAELDFKGPIKGLVSLQETLDKTAARIRELGEGAGFDTSFITQQIEEVQAKIKAAFQEDQRFKVALDIEADPEPLERAASALALVRAQLAGSDAEVARLNPHLDSLSLGFEQAAAKAPQLQEAIENLDADDPAIPALTEDLLKFKSVAEAARIATEGLAAARDRLAERGLGPPEPESGAGGDQGIADAGRRTREEMLAALGSAKEFSNLSTAGLEALASGALVIDQAAKAANGSIRLITPAAAAAAEALKKAGETKAEPKVTPKVDQGALSEVKGDLKTVTDPVTKQVKVINDAGAQATAQAAQKPLTDPATKTIKAELAPGAVEAIQGQIETITGKKVPISLDTTGVEGAIATINDALSAVSGKQIAVSLDTAGIEAGIATINDALAQVADKKVALTVDDATVSESIGRINEALGQLADKQVSITLDHATVAESVGRINEALALLTDKSIAVTLDAATVTDTLAQVTASLAAISDKQIRITVDASISDAITRVTEALATVTDKQVAITVNESGISDAIARINEALGQLADKTVSVKVEVDATPLADLQAAIQQITDKAVAVTVDTAAAQASIAVLGTALAQLSDRQVAVGFVADRTGLADVTAALDSVQGRDIRVGFAVDQAGLAAVSSVLEAIEGKDIPVRFSVDTAALAQVAVALEGLTGKDLPIRFAVDTAGLADVTAALAGIQGKNVAVGFTVDRTGLADVSAALASVQGRNIPIGFTVDPAGLAGLVAAVDSIAIPPKAVSITADLSAFNAAIAAIPPVVATRTILLQAQATGSPTLPMSEYFGRYVPSLLSNVEKLKPSINFGTDFAAKAAQTFASITGSVNAQSAESLRPSIDLLARGLSADRGELLLAAEELTNNAQRFLNSLQSTGKQGLGSAAEKFATAQNSLANELKGLARQIRVSQEAQGRVETGRPGGPPFPEFPFPVFDNGERVGWSRLQETAAQHLSATGRLVDETRETNTLLRKTTQSAEPSIDSVGSQQVRENTRSLDNLRAAVESARLAAPTTPANSEAVGNFNLRNSAAASLPGADAILSGLSGIAEHQKLLRGEARETNSLLRETNDLTRTQIGATDRLGSAMTSVQSAQRQVFNQQRTLRSSGSRYYTTGG